MQSGRAKPVLQTICMASRRINIQLAHIEGEQQSLKLPELHKTSRKD